MYKTFFLSSEKLTASTHATDIPYKMQKCRKRCFIVLWYTEDGAKEVTALLVNILDGIRDQFRCVTFYFKKTVIHIDLINHLK